MSIRIAVNGALGNMGTLISKALTHHEKFNLVSKSNSTAELKNILNKKLCDIVIDFTHPSSVYENTKLILENNCHPIIGTTGLTSEQITELQDISEKKSLGGLIAPNFSIGAICMFKCVQIATKYLTDVEIIEMHHNKKADIPSGTAIKTAQLINQVSSKDKEIPIHSIRLPGLLAHQEIIFGGKGETFKIKHDTLDRTCFLPGIFLALEKITTLKKLYYGLEEIINF